MAINIMEAFQQEPPQLDDIHALWINRIQDWLEPHQSRCWTYNFLADIGVWGATELKTNVSRIRV